MTVLRYLLAITGIVAIVLSFVLNSGILFALSVPLLAAALILPGGSGPFEDISSTSGGRAPNDDDWR